MSAAVCWRSVTDVPEREPSKAERKKARRKQRAASERAGALDVLADAAVEEAIVVVARVADDGELGLSTEVTTLEAARYCLKRINDALRMDEWLDEVEVWVWDAHTSVRRPITLGGETHGVELRIEPRLS